MDKENVVRAERKSLQRELLKWNCPLSVLVAVPSTSSGCGLMDEAVLAFSHSSVHELLAAEAMNEMLLKTHAENDGKPVPAQVIMKKLALPPSPLQDFGGGESRDERREEEHKEVFVSAFSSISRCGIVSKLMVLLQHDIGAKRLKLEQDEKVMRRYTRAQIHYSIDTLEH
jgi:hypothetical protein